MIAYLFRNKELGLSNEGIHLMRNGFNYETIGYQDIQKVEIAKGSALKNRTILLVGGIGLLGLGLYLILQIIDAFSPDSTVQTIYIEGLLLPVLPMAIGGYCLYAVLKKETILKISGKKNLTCSLAQFEKDNQLQSIREFLKSRTTLKQ